MAGANLVSWAWRRSSPAAGSRDDLDIAAPLFFALLLTLIVTLYDRYRPVHLTRFSR